MPLLHLLLCLTTLLLLLTSGDAKLATPSASKVGIEVTCDTRCNGTVSETVAIVAIVTVGAVACVALVVGGIYIGPVIALKAAAVLGVQAAGGQTMAIGGGAAAAAAGGAAKVVQDWDWSTPPVEPTRAA